MKALTSVTIFKTGEGTRLSYTFSEIDEKGKITSQNNRENFVVTDPEFVKMCADVEEYVKTNKLEG